MGKFEWSFKLFSRDGIKFLLLELIIVFLGVYGAFLLQSYGEQRKIEAEREKVLVGLKEDLEYFRIFFPGFSSGMNRNISEWNQLIAENEYVDFSGWRFIQPQYDYTVVEYALNADAEVIDFDMNSSLSMLYTELEKLRQAEELITTIALMYKAIPSGIERTPEIQMAHQNNFLNLVRLRDRAEDRVNILERVAVLSSESLEQINAEFSATKLKELELALIEKSVENATDQERQFYMNTLKKYFPNLSEEEINAALEK